MFKTVIKLHKANIKFPKIRTKFKRKYTSDVETLASHYYSSLGIGGIARPMVVGDRLWLFSQPPHGPPAPLQSLLLNNVPPAPQHMSSIHPSVLTRNYAPPPGSTGIPRHPAGYNISPSSQSSSFMNKQMRFDYFNKLQFSPYNRPPSHEPVDFRFGNKPILKPENLIDDASSQNLSDLANLESRFGNNSSILSENGKFQDAINANDDSRSSSSSDIDCEELEN